MHKTIPFKAKLMKGRGISKQSISLLMAEGYIIIIIPRYKNDANNSKKNTRVHIINFKMGFPAFFIALQLFERCA